MIFGPLHYVPYAMSAMLAGGLTGLGLAWWLRRRTTISVRNLYPLALVMPMLDLAAIQRDDWLILVALLPLTSCVVAAALAGRRWRLSDLGAGDELRQYELRRRWLWQPATWRVAGERVRIGTQGQIIREREWPASEPFVPLTADTDGPRAPRGSGRHVFTAGATGSGKTTSALRCAAGRVLKDNAALFFVDQKGDPGAETFLRRLAAHANVPFILLDPRATDSDHWQPLWGDHPAEVVARVLAGIETSEPYYADVLRQHVTLTAATLYTAGLWPPSLPLLVDASQLAQFPRIRQLAAQRQDNHPDLQRRVRNHARFVQSSEGQKALAGGLLRLDLVIGEAWRNVLTPRAAEPAGELVAVSLANAIREHAVVLWRTHVDQMPDEARTVTALILNDIHASAIEAQAAGPAPWTVVLDEFGAVITTAGDQALALLQRGRTHEGRVHVTQSVADIEAVTGQPGLLASMADNFTAFIIHHQTAPESRDWLAKLMGTTALWQSTDQTAGHAATGAGTRRRVREFRIASDQFGLLNTGEAVIHTTLGPPPMTCKVKALRLPDQEPQRIGAAAASDCEMTVHPAAQLTSNRGGEEDPASSETPNRPAGRDPSSGTPRRTHGMENL